MIAHGQPGLAGAHDDGVNLLDHYVAPELSPKTHPAMRRVLQ
jgi:hypothetical protein